MECLACMYIRKEYLEGYKLILGISKFNKVISGADRGMGYLLGLKDGTPYHLVVFTRKLLTRLWARREYILANRNEGAVRREAVDDVNLTQRLVLDKSLCGVNSFNRKLI